MATLGLPHCSPPLQHDHGGDEQPYFESEEDECESVLRWRLENRDTRIRLPAMLQLRSRGSLTVMQHVTTLISGMQVEDSEEVLAVELDLLRQIDVTLLGDSLEPLAELVAHKDFRVSQVVTALLLRAPASVLEANSELLVRAWLEKEGPIGHLAWKLISKMEPEHLAKEVPLLVRGLQQSRAAIVQRSLEVCRLLPAEFHSNLCMAVFRCVWHAESRVRSQAEDYFANLPAAELGKTLHMKGGVEKRATLLHMAASDGHLALCTRLVEQGAMVRVPDGSGRTPSELALLHRHIAVFNFLVRSEIKADLSAGLESAALSALCDERAVVKAEWYTLSLPGFLGQAGALHSLVAVTVEDDSGQLPATYTLEKAAYTGGGTCFDTDSSEWIHHGVVISRWEDVACYLEKAGRPFRSLEKAGIAKSRGDTSMFHLWSLAVLMGPYDVGTCNCHHAAMLIYNACARESLQVRRMPNELLTSVVKVLQAIGFSFGADEIDDDFASRESSRCTSQTEKAMPLEELNQKLVRVFPSQVPPCPHGDDIVVEDVALEMLHKPNSQCLGPMRVIDI
mmetsp:Transcript_34492/g.77323  ORF Transcript_34492/g.77323 Transcript_34492/m.77323 type:complete len:565 (+) Transcript_34492:97-1791(+)